MQTCVVTLVLQNFDTTMHNAACICCILTAVFPDRLAKGRSVHSICEAVHQAACDMTPGAELDALKAWAWQFGIQVTGFMIKVTLPTSSLWLTMQMLCK